jgi:hypothetical protein
MRYRLWTIGLLVGSFLLTGQGIAAPAYAAETFLLLDRLTFGETASEAARLKVMGLNRWLDAELHPPAADNLRAQVQQQITRST